MSWLGWRSGGRDRLDWDRQTVANPGHGFDDGRCTAVVAEGCAELMNGRRQRCFDDRDLRPDRVEQFGLGNDLARPQQQLAQDFERLGFDRDAPTMNGQRPVGFIEDAAGERPATRAALADNVPSWVAHPDLQKSLMLTS